MAFVARLDGGRLIGALVCDAEGYGQKIDYTAALDASIVAVPPVGEGPIPVLFACSAACEGALLSAAGDGAGALDLPVWWDAMASGLGLDGEEDDDDVDVDDFLAALGTLEDATQRPGVPAGLTVRAALARGYLSQGHVAVALSAAGMGAP